MTRKYFIYIIAAGVCTSAVSCNHAKHTGAAPAAMQGNWQKQPILVDGDSQDWPSPYPNYDSKAMIAYATSNDKDNLYITFETGDAFVQAKILKSGATVWIDTSGKKEQAVAIHYPLPNDEPMELPGADNPLKDAQINNNMAYQKLKSSLGAATQLSLEGFNACNGGYAISQTNTCGIRVRIGIDEYKEMIWEAVVPFKAIYGKEQITRQDAGKPISVCFAIKGMKRPSTSNNNNNDNAMGNGQMGTARIGQNSRRATGGRVGGQDNPKDRLYESTKTWKQFGLAYE